MLEVFTWATPNGHKVHIALEELGLPYKVIPIDIGAYAKERLPYAIGRYTNEVGRLNRVLNRRLDESHWLAGDEYSMADIITFPWIRTATEPSPRFAERGYVDLGEYPAMKRWYDEIAARPAVQRGLAVPAGGPAQSPITDAEREITFGKTQFAVR